MVEERDVLQHIHELVDAEHALRRRLSQGELTTEEEHAALTTLEQQLDQCWDLLRQRRALRETGGDPREASVRPPGQVEDYLN